MLIAGVQSRDVEPMLAAHVLMTQITTFQPGRHAMKYIALWLLGVPIVGIVLLKLTGMI